MNNAVLKNRKRQRRKKHVRKRVLGTPDRPRLTVFRSNIHIYVQVIDDVTGATLVSSSSLGLKVSNGGNCKGAAEVGRDIAKKALKQGLKSVVFDRNGYKYHGRIRALADAARESGLEF